MATPHQDSNPAESGTIVEFLAGLPIELSGAIFAHLSYSDLKKLRLASRRFSKVVTPYLSFKRVFISASNHNIQVFRNIANHETFRHDVREIVWDDARFMVSLEEESGYHSGYGYDAADSDSEDTPVPEGVPSCWPTPPLGARIPCESWVDEAIKDKWRGFRIVTHLLAQQEYATVPEVVIDGNQINSGLTFRKPGSSMLKLSIMVGMHAEQNYAVFRNGRLRQLLTADLESFALETDEVTNLSFSRPWPPENPVDHFIPLRSIFPVEAWTHLRHFGLSRFLVKENDLLDLLGALPDTLRSVELSFLWFVRNSGGYRSLLFRIRDDLGWRSRSVKPQIMIRDDKKLTLPGRGIHMDKEVMKFLYDSGENPYPDDPRMRTVLEGVGTVRDVFEPRFERPFVTREELIRLGIQKGWSAD
ncbi:hypothetical protein K4K54_011730 [Colletotrichum sp. SAR 10_86]|nr:hypothetical protein K4K54_011730 [Colletotrichum sp. SAR 10_86]